MDVEAEKINVEKLLKFKQFYSENIKFYRNPIDRAVAEGIIQNGNLESEFFYDKTVVRLNLTQMQLYGFFITQQYWVNQIFSRSKYPIEQLEKILYFHRLGLSYEVDAVINILDSGFRYGPYTLAKYTVNRVPENRTPGDPIGYHMQLDVGWDVKPGYLRHTEEVLNLFVDIVRGAKTYAEQTGLPEIYPLFYELRNKKNPKYTMDFEHVPMEITS